MLRHQPPIRRIAVPVIQQQRDPRIRLRANHPPDRLRHLLHSRQHIRIQEAVAQRPLEVRPKHFLIQIHLRQPDPDDHHAVQLPPRQVNSLRKHAAEDTQAQHVAALLPISIQKRPARRLVHLLLLHLTRQHQPLRRHPQKCKTGEKHKVLAGFSRHKRCNLPRNLHARR